MKKKIVFYLVDKLQDIQEKICITNKISIHKKTPLIKNLVKLNYYILKKGGIS